jgi:hypothetical protein
MGASVSHNVVRILDLDPSIRELGDSRGAGLRAVAAVEAGEGGGEGLTWT